MAEPGMSAAEEKAAAAAASPPSVPTAVAGAPVFLGAWRGRHPINVQCGACGYTGQSVVMKKWGAAATTWAVMTLGFGAPWGKCVAGDIQHLCPNCNRLLAKSAPL